MARISEAYPPFCLLYSDPTAKTRQNHRPSVETLRIEATEMPKVHDLSNPTQITPEHHPRMPVFCKMLIIIRTLRRHDNQRNREDTEG
jgi:hypothetical protein